MQLPATCNLRVLVVGGQGVGKSSLCSQFVSAENINTYELAQDQGQGGVHRCVAGTISEIIKYSRTFV